MSLLKVEKSSLLGSEFFKFGFDLFLEQPFDFAQLQILLRHRFSGLFSPVFEHSRACSLLDHGKDFNSFHVQNFCDTSLHNEEIGVVDVQLNTLEQVLHRLLLRAMAVDQVFARTAEYDLSGNRNRRIFLKTDGRFFRVAVIEDDGHTGLGHTRLSTFVNEILEILRPDGRHIRNSEDKTDGV